MRILLDESRPRHLARELSGHQVRTLRQQGWQGLKNGELLKRAKSAGFSVLATADQNLEYQQNIAGMGMGILVIAARTTRIEDLRPLVPAMLEALESIQANQVAHVGE